jgi:hypothetical protein
VTRERDRSFSIIGVGVAACIACCAGPILAFLGGLGVAGLASTALIGLTGLAIAAAALVGVVVVRRRRSTCGTAVAPVPVAAPSRVRSNTKENLR